MVREGQLILEERLVSKESTKDVSGQSAP
jgi:hypothetical protein